MSFLLLGIALVLAFLAGAERQLAVYDPYDGGHNIWALILIVFAGVTGSLAMVTPVS